MSINKGVARIPGLFRDPASLPVLFIALAAFFVFSGTLGHGLVWDDEPVIRYARMAVEEGGITALATVPFSTGLEGSGELSGYYRPVSLISMWINSPTGKPSPFAYHLGNIFLHVINSLLVFVLLKLILRPGSGPLLGSLIFAVHPVHSESVAFTAGRTDLLAALFILPVLILWCRSGDSPETTGKDHLAAGMFFFALACLSKEIAFVVPAGVFLWLMVDGNPIRRIPRPYLIRRVRWLAGLFLVLGAVLFVRLVVLKIGTGPGFSRYADVGDANLISLLGGVGANVLTYLRLMVFPWPLSVFYPPVPPPLTWITWLSSFAYLVLCLALSGRRHNRVGLISLFWTLLFLFPVSGVVGLGQSVIAERFCYLPSIGVAMLLGYALSLAGSRAAVRTPGTVLVALILVLFSVGTVVHSARWKDNLTLFTSALDSNEVKVPTIYVSLGVAHKDRGDPESALAAFEEAVRLDPSYLKGWLNLGVTLSESDDAVRALEAFDQARVLAPSNPAVWYNRAVALESLGREEEALADFSRTVLLDPGEAAASYRKGKLLSRMGRHEEALDVFREVVRVDRGHAGAYIGMGRIHENLGRTDQAVEMYMMAIRVNPDEVIAYSDLGRILLETGKVLEALEVFQMAEAIAPGDAVAARGFVVALLQAGEREKAEAYVRELQSRDMALSAELSDLIETLGGGPVE